MTDSHDERFDALFEAVLTGETSVDDPEVRRMLEEAPELAERLARMQSLAGALDDVGSGEQQELKQALESRPEIEQQVSAWAQKNTRRDTGPVVSKWGWAAAVAAVLLVAAWATFRDPSTDPSPPTPEVYLDVQLNEMKPDADGARGEVFVWNFELPPGGKYVLKLFEGSDTLEPLRTIRMRSATEWRPTETERAELPEDLRWEIVVQDAGGRRVGGGVRQLRLRR